MIWWRPSGLGSGVSLWDYSTRGGCDFFSPMVTVILLSFLTENYLGPAMKSQEGVPVRPYEEQIDQTGKVITQVHFPEWYTTM